MKTIRIDHKNIPKLQESVCAIGYFDGLHIGHQELLLHLILILGKLSTLMRI